MTHVDVNASIVEGLFDLGKGGQRLPSVATSLLIIDGFSRRPGTQDVLSYYHSQTLGRDSTRRIVSQSVGEAGRSATKSL